MTDTTHRVLRLLGLLESRSVWSASELAERLDVTERTVRRDVVRLRELGYPVESERGLDGGYRLGAGRRLPPLMLEDDEAVALVACLRMAALSGQDSLGEAGLRALTKLDQVLPPRLRALATAVHDATQSLPRTRPEVAWQLLSALAMAQRDSFLVRFRYRRPSGETTEREVEPARLMTQGEHWYLQGFDRLREDWRVFRLDRISFLVVTSWRFTPRATPSPNFARDIPSRYPCSTRVEMAVDVDALAARIPAAHRDELDATPTGCRFRAGASSWEELAWHLLWVSRDLGTPLRLGKDADELREALGRIAESAQDAAVGLRRS